MPELLLDRVSAPTDDIRRLIHDLDEELGAQYPPHQRHGLALDAIFQPHIRFFLARLDGAPAGCGGLALFGRFAEVKRMFVRPASRGHGIAQALLDRVEQEARSAGLTTLRLETGPRQFAALRLYERYGFRPCGAFGDYAAMDPARTAASIFMEKLLPAPQATP